MKILSTILIALFVCHPAMAQDDLDSKFYADLEEIEAKYRAGKAELIRKADRVVVYLGALLRSSGLFSMVHQALHFRIRAFLIPL